MDEERRRNAEKAYIEMDKQRREARLKKARPDITLEEIKAEIKYLKMLVDKFYQSKDGFRKLSAFSQTLRDKYPDHMKYVLYNVMGDAEPEGDIWDFPGEDSVEAFLERESKLL